jgi:hypothetical protein
MGRELSQVRRVCLALAPLLGLVTACNQDASPNTVASRRSNAISPITLVYLFDGSNQSAPSNATLRLALVALPIGARWVRNELDRGQSPFDVARSLYSGRRSDILYAGKDDRAGLLYIIGVDGAIASIADEYPRFVHEMEKISHEGASDPGR